MQSVTISSAALLLALMSPAAALLPSFGVSTAKGTRNKLSDGQFIIRRTSQPTTVGPNRRYLVYSSSPIRNPALAATDTQMSVSTIIIRAGKDFFKHYHARGAEVVIVRQGKLMVEFSFEGFNPRVVRNVIRVGEATVFPQALKHNLRCVSNEDCIVNGVFNTADGGTVPV